MGNINERIKELIKILKIKKKDFAEKLERSSGNISDWLSGRGNVSKSSIDKICKEFNVNHDWLTEGKGEVFSKDPRALDQATIDYYNLTNQEQKLILKFRLLSPDRQSIAVGIINGLAEPYESHYNYREELSA